MYSAFTCTRNIYICRVQQKRLDFNSEWRGATAAGARDPFTNPHFVIQVTKPMTVQLQMEQDQVRDDGPGGKLLYIGFFVLTSQGKRVRQIKRDKNLIAFHPLVNDLTVSKEVFLDTPNQRYTIVCATKLPKQEALFTLSVFCDKANEANISFKAFPDNVPRQGVS